MRKITQAIVAAMAAVAFFAAAPSGANLPEPLAKSPIGAALTISDARAGTYNVYQCHGAYGNANSGWGWYNNFNSTAGNPTPVEGCGGYFKLQATGSTAGNFSRWNSPPLPGNLGLSRMNFDYIGDNGGGRITPIVHLCTANSIATPGAYGQCGGFVYAYLGNPGSNWVGGGVGDCTTLNNPTTRCKAFQLSISQVAGTYAGAYWLRNLQAVVNDPDAPYAWQPHNGTLRSNESVNNAWGTNHWNSGTKTVQVAALDSNSGGVKNTKIFFDGASGAGSPDHNFNQPCSFASWQPCPSFASNIPNIDTTALADGPHTATTRATDAGDNVTDATVAFKVDNTEPDTPTAVAIAGASQGWSATNDFDVSWINTTEEAETTTQSGIAEVKVNVEPTDPANQADPAAVTIPVGGTASGISATVNSVTGLTVPAVGEWTLRLSVIDRAGNESPVGDGTGGSADSDFTIGYDPTPPAAPAGQANGWISRLELANGYDQQWTYTDPPDAVAPICGFAGSISLSQIDNPGTSINVPGDVRKWRLPANLTENNHWVHLRAVTCAGLASSTTENVEAKVDLTDPTGSVSGVENGKWYKDGQQVGLHGADALSGMAPGTSPDPDDGHTSGAYLDYTINGTPPAAADIPRGADATISVTGEGQKELRLSPVDFAGNKAAAKIVNFGIDASNPTGHFAARSSSNPRLLRAPIGDGVSGVALSVIEVRQRSDGDWQLLPTSLADLSGNPIGGYPTSAVASAIFPDTSLPAGTYIARVRAYDQAGNELVTSKDENGNTFTFENPMREAVALSAGLLKAQRTCNKKRTSKGKKRGKKVQRNGKCFKKHRGKVVFVGAKPTLTVGYKRGAVVQGVLTTPKLAALSRQPIEIYARSKTSGEQLLGTTSTRADGSYVFKIKPGVSRTIRIYYPGTNTRQDASAAVQLGTGAKLKLRASTRHARTGQTVTFRGSVRSFDGTIPAAGKIVALQFYAGRKWRPAVAIAHTDAKGNFRVKYKFDRISKGVKARIVFRVYAPAEDGWNHTASSSKRITMRLN